MEPLQIAERLKNKFPDEVLSAGEFRGQAFAIVKKDYIADICRYLHDDPEISLDHLRDLCGVDYMGKKENRFEVVYNLLSIKYKHKIRIRAEVTEEHCSIDSVVPIWIGADSLERECYDMFGITFNGHPNLSRILLPEDWKGYPLRKDYPITGPGPEEEWAGYKEILEKSEELKRYEWNR